LKFNTNSQYLGDKCYINITVMIYVIYVQHKHHVLQHGSYRDHRLF